MFRVIQYVERQIVLYDSVEDAAFSRLIQHIDELSLKEYIHLLESKGNEEKLLERFRNPKNVGEIKNADGIGKVGNLKCGDIMKLYIKVKNNKIIDAKFNTFGCAAAIASSDVLCDLAKGKTIEQALKITSKDIAKELGEMPKVKLHCSVLGAKALQEAIKDFKKRKKA